MTLPLAIGLWGNLAVVLFVVTCLALVLIVLLQKGRGGGLSAAFGGGGAGSLLGTKTGDVLTWITICLVAFFLVLAVLMGKFVGRDNTSSLGMPPATATQQGDQAETDVADTPETVAAEVVEGATDVVEATAEVVEETTEAVAEEAKEAVSEAKSVVESVTETAEENTAK